MSLPHDIEGVRVLGERLARDHAANGGKVIGYVTPCVPAELIEAAGMRPIMLSAGTETSTTLGDRVMEDLFDTSIRGIFERLLKREFDFLSAIVLPRANDSAHRLYYYLSELKRTAQAELPPVLLCDVVMTPDEASRGYSVEALQRLWNELRTIGNSDAGDTELRAAVRSTNQATRWLMDVAAERRTGVLPGAGALTLYAAAHLLPRHELQARSERGARIPAPDAAAKRPRVMICGSAQTDAGLHGLIEASDGVVVMDCHAGGELALRRLIDEHKTPLEAIADRLRDDQAASRRFADVAGEAAAFARLFRVDLAIFSYFPEEEALTWDYPEQKAALESAGVRVLRLSEQKRPFDVAANRAAVEAFVRGAGK
jgi:benzoyl-CoA reductase/2-hydroxyglutaryl-CoA dehydratase subunit BcrC/BadD/HgdB